MIENKIEFDLNSILVDVIKLDSNLQDSIKRKVTEKIIESIADKFLDEYYEKKYYSDNEYLKDEVFDILVKQQEEFIKKIVKDFGEKVSYWCNDKRKKSLEEFQKAINIILEPNSRKVYKKEKFIEEAIEVEE